MRKEYSTRVKKWPRCKRYAKRLLRSPSTFKIQTPSDAMAERDWIVYQLTKDDEIGGPRWKFLDRDRKVDYRFRSVVAEAVANSQLFLWRNQIVGAAKKLVLPDHVFGIEGWPFRQMTWLSESNFQVQYQSRRLSMPATYLTLINDVALLGYIFIDEETKEFFIASEQLKVGERVFKDTSEPDAFWYDALKMISFLNSRYVDSRSRLSTDKEKKEILKYGNQLAAEESVSVVTLRAARNKHSESDDGENNKSWAGRWWVRGHIRAQWHPSTKTHELIYIAPHLKGPEDKPILEKLYHVRR